MNFIFSRIRYKLIAAFIILLLIPFLTFGLYSYYETSKAFHDVIVDSELDELVISANAIRIYLNTILKDIKHISESQPLNRLIRARKYLISDNIQREKKNFSNSIINYTQFKGLYHHISYVDENGQELIRINNNGSIMEAVESSNLPSEFNNDFFKKAMSTPTDQYFVSDIYLNTDHNKHEPVVLYAKPVFYSNDNPAGVVAVVAYANPVLQKLNLTVDKEIDRRYLIDRDGFYFLHHDSTKLWGRDLHTGFNFGSDHSTDVLKKVTAKDNGFVQHSKNMICFVAVTPPGQSATSWKLLNIIEMNKAMAPFDDYRNMFILVLVLSMIGAVILAITLAQGISKPVLHLTQIANRISHGELDMNIEVKSKDEIGQLADSINRMRASLEAAIIRLRKQRNR